MKALINYLNSPLINVAEICRVCEINPGFMSGVLKGTRKMPEKHLWHLVRCLCGEHGFILTGHVIRFDDHCFIHSKPIEGIEDEIEEREDGRGFIYKVSTNKGLITDGEDLTDFLKSLN